MQRGAVRRRGYPSVIGRWRADSQSIVVETEDPDLRRVADEVLTRPQTIPIHAAERYEFAGGAEPLVERPSTIKFLALFALEMEERGFELDAEEE